MDSREKNERIESVERWAEFVRNNKDWKKHHTKFINAQFQKSREIIKKLPKEKIIKLYNIKNLKGYEKLLK